MGQFLYGIGLQWKLDVRNKEILLTYYVVPLVFFGFMGGIFTSIIPTAYQTLIQSMTVFGVTMGAFLGTPSPLVDTYGSEIKKSYLVGKIPLWTVAVNNFISAFIHLLLMSVVIFLIAPVAFNAELPGNILQYFATLSIFIISSICVGTVLGLLVKSNAKLTMISQLIFLPSIMLSGIMFPSEMLPKALQYIGKLSPATWGYRSMISDTFPGKTMIPLVVIAAGCMIVCVWGLKKIEN